MAKPDLMFNFFVFLTVVDFLAYRPSEIAAAALLCAADELALDRADLVCTFEKLIDQVKKKKT